MRTSKDRTCRRPQALGDAEGAPPGSLPGPGGGYHTYTTCAYTLRPMLGMPNQSEKVV